MPNDEQVAAFSKAFNKTTTTLAEEYLNGAEKEVALATINFLSGVLSTGDPECIRIFASKIFEFISKLHERPNI